MTCLVEVNRGDIENVVFAIDEDDYEKYVENWGRPWLKLDKTGSGCAPGKPTGARYIYTYDERKRKTSIHRLIMSAEIEAEAQRRGCDPKKLTVDHINGDTLDNRRGNLRVVTQSQNLLSPQKKKTTSHKTTSDQIGVHYDKINDLWCARIMKQSSVLRGASFKTEEDAKNWYKVEKAKHAREIGMDAEPLERLPALVEVHKRIDAWYIVNATGESEEVREVRLAKKTEHNRGVKRELQSERTRELADVTEELNKDPNNLDLLKKKFKLDRANTFSQNRATGEKHRKTQNENQNVIAAAKRANERENLENAEQTDEVRAKLKKLATREKISRARREGTRADVKQKWRENADAARRAAFDTLMTREGADELLHQYNICLPVDRLAMVEREPYKIILNNARRNLKGKKDPKDVALLEFIIDFEKIMKSTNASKAALKRWSNAHATATESPPAYSAEADLENANREMDDFLAENQALYDEYNKMCKTTRRDHLVLNTSDMKWHIGEAKRTINKMRDNKERADLVRFMDEIEWRMNRLKQCTRLVNE